MLTQRNFLYVQIHRIKIALWRSPFVSNSISLTSLCQYRGVHFFYTLQIQNYTYNTFNYHPQNCPPFHSNQNSKKITQSLSFWDFDLLPLLLYCWGTFPSCFTQRNLLNFFSSKPALILIVWLFWAKLFRKLLIHSLDVCFQNSTWCS